MIIRFAFLLLLYIVPCILAGQSFANSYIYQTNEQRSFLAFDTCRGGLVTCGYLSDNSTGIVNVVVTKTTAGGFPEWSYEFGGAFANYLIPQRIATGKDGIYIAGGLNGSPTNYGGFLLKLDSSGNQMWLKLTPRGGEAISTTADSGCIVLTAGSDAVKYDKLGNREWNVHYGNQLVCKRISAIDSVAYAISGRTASYNPFVLKIGSNGTVIWYREYILPQFFTPGFQDMTVTDDGGIAISGDYGCIKTDANGNLRWANHYGVSGYGGFRAIAAGRDNSVMLAGSVIIAAFWEQALVLLDSNGIVTWNNVTESDSIDCVFDLKRTGLNQFAFITSDQSPPYSQNILCKFDTSSVIHCLDTNVNITVQQLNISTLTGITQNTSAYTDSSVTFNRTPINVAAYDKCSWQLIADVNQYHPSDISTTIIYPNPFTEQTIVSVTNATPEMKHQIDLVTIDGIHIKSQQFTGKAVCLSAEKMVPGIYIYSITRGGQLIGTGKLVVN